MKQKIYKIFFLFFISVLALVFKSDVSNGCGWSPEPDSYYSIFEPGLFKLPLLKPFFLSENEYFPYEKTSSLSDKTDNLKEWIAYFKNVPTIDDVDRIIYSTKKEDILKIINYLKNGDDSLLILNYKHNTLINYWGNHNYSNVLEYVLFTKKCEPYFTVKDEWENYKRDTTGMSDLINYGLIKYSACKDSFLRDRYAFQIIRLEHYSYHYKEAIHLFDKNFGKSRNSLIKYWALEHKAGCLYKLGDLVRSNYLFASIFDKCPGRRVFCTRSFKLYDDSLNKLTLALCKNTNEKTAVISLAAYKSGHIDIPAMEEIYKLNPKSEYLELLLQRGISKMEREILPPTYENLQNFDHYFNYYITEPYNEFGKIVDKIAEGNKTKHPYLWNFAAGYISVLNNESDKAEAYFIKAKRICPKDDLTYVSRIKIVEVIAMVTGLKTIDRQAENDIYSDLSWLRKDSDLEKLKSREAFYFIMSLLGKKYYLQNDTVKANLCMGTRVTINEWGNMASAFGYDLRKDYYKEPIQQIYDFIQLPNLSPFEKFLVDNYSVKSSQLKEMIATKYILQHNFEEAKNLLSDLSRNHDWPNDDLEKLPANPFIIHINDCHDCDYAAMKVKKFNKLLFVNRMIELKNRAEKDTANAAKYYFTLANGYYNTTMYGNNWMAIAYPIIFLDHTIGIPVELPNEFFDCSTAREYYVKAMRASKDREFAAKCCFMASKCEQNKFYYDVESSGLYDNNPKYYEMKSRYRSFFKILKNEYPDTKFYREAIEECKYFHSYVKR
jgi:hypothetical protein